MRKAMIALLLVATGAAAQAQRVKPSDVPQPVTAAFAQIFPQVGKVKWEREDARFEAEFKENGQETSAVFDAAGQLLEKETEIRKTQLPVEAQGYLGTTYIGWEIEETARLERNGQTFYEAEVEKGKETWELVFDAAGNLVEKNREDDEDDD
jgi:uncharacterized membrane protein YkoI